MITTVGIVFSTGLSTVALVLAWRALAVKRLPARRIERCELMIEDLDVRHGQLHGQVRRINARLAARDRRSGGAAAASADDSDAPPISTPIDGTGVARLEGESDLEWKRRVRALIAAGKVSHG